MNDKKFYAIVTPDPRGERKNLVVDADALGEVFSELDTYGRVTYKVQIVKRTERWFKQFPEI